MWRRLAPDLATPHTGALNAAASARFAATLAGRSFRKTFDRAIAPPSKHPSPAVAACEGHSKPSDTTEKIAGDAPQGSAHACSSSQQAAQAGGALALAPDGSFHAFTRGAVELHKLPVFFVPGLNIGTNAQV